MDRATFEHMLLQVLAANVPHRIYAKDVQGRFVFANPAVCRGMGVREPADLLGKTDFDFYPAQEARQYFEQEQAILRTGEPMLNREERVKYLLLDDEAWLLTTKIPLRDPDGRAVGLVGINYDITPQKCAERALAQTVARLDEEVGRRREAEEALRTQAMHDWLTGLPNRALLMDRMEQAIRLAQRGRHELTLLFIDLDHFKPVNDSLGHAAGDELLKSVARRIRGCIRASDTLARLGGDEFVLLLPNPVGADVLSRLTARIAQAVAEPVAVAGHEVTVTCSIGCGVYPRDGEDAAALLRHADEAMYRAKARGRDRATAAAPCARPLRLRACR